jgi:hypothetical protein
MLLQKSTKTRDQKQPLTKTEAPTRRSCSKDPSNEEMSPTNMPVLLPLLYISLICDVLVQARLSFAAVGDENQNLKKYQQDSAGTVQQTEL